MRHLLARSARRKFRHMADDKLTVRDLINTLCLFAKSSAWLCIIQLQRAFHDVLVRRINGILLFAFDNVPTSDLHSSCTGDANSTLGVSTVQ